MDAVELLRAAYQPLIGFARNVDDRTGWLPTQLPGWAVRDLLFHLANDCHRALVALAAPCDQPPDTDDVSYWSAWKPETDAAQASLRAVRMSASVWTSVRGPADMYADAAAAVIAVAASADPAKTVLTQGHALTVDSRLRTLAVEATVHHLDLEPALSDPPSPEALAEVRRVLNGLLGTDAPKDWDVVRYVRVGTGRLELNASERAGLGRLADEFPLFG